MGSRLSTPTHSVEEERRRRVEQEQREQAEQKRRQKERERQEEIKKEAEQRLKEERELERERRLEETEDSKRLVEKEVKYKELEYRHLEETQKLKGIDLSNERKDSLSAKEVELEHERLMQGQKEVLSIVGDAFKRAEVTNLNEAAYAAYILQCVQNNQPVNMEVLSLVASKVNNPPPLNLEELVDKTVKRTIQEENEFGEDGYSGFQRPPMSPLSRQMMEQD